MAKISFIVLFTSVSLFASSLTPYDMKINEGRSLMERCSYHRAIECFKVAISIDSSRPEAYYYLALIYEQNGDYKRAISFWEKRYQINPDDKNGQKAREHFIFLNIIKDRKKFLENINLPEKLEKMHFIIYHNNYLYASKLVFKAEASYKKILHDLGVVRFPMWDRFKCVLLLFPEREDYIKSTSAPSWSGGLAQYHRFLFATFEGAPELEKKTLPHELTHLAFQMFMGSSVKIPLWLNEGLAKYEEEGKSYLRYMREYLSRDKFFPLAELFSVCDYPEDEISLFYSQCASIIYYLKEKNISSLFSQFLREIKKGTEINHALKKIYQWKFRNGVIDLEQRWRYNLLHERN